MNAVERVLAKHRQARMHLMAFHDAGNAFLNPEPYRLAREFNSDCTEYIFRVYDVKPVPEAISLIAGDVIHNARACLDHLAWHIAQNPVSSTTFQIKNARVRDGLGGFRDPTIDGGISSRHHAALVSVQPYTTHPASPEDSPLAILHALDITDKHQVVLTSVASIEGNIHGRPVNYRGSEPVPKYEWGPLKDGEPVARFFCSEPSPEMEVQFQLIPSISLNDIGAACRAEDARDILWSVCEAVENTVHAFEPF